MSDIVYPKIINNLATPYVLEQKAFYDERGFFTARTFEHFKVVQESLSYSKGWVARGIHFQKGDYAQAKVIRVLEGEILDFAVDLREDSETYGNCYYVNLNGLISSEDFRYFYIPRGFGHGFVALTDDVYFQYLVDNDYCPEAEGGYQMDIEFLSNMIDVDWNGQSVQLSDKDKKWDKLPEGFIKQFIELE